MEEEQKTQSNIWELLRYLRMFRGRIAVALLFVLISTLFSVADPYVTKMLIDVLVQGSPQTQTEKITFLIILFFVLRWGTNVFDGAKDYVFAKAQSQIRKAISLDVFEHLIDLPAAFHANRSTGGVSRKISRGTLALQTIFAFLSFNIIPTLFQIVFVVAIFLRLFPVSFTLMFLAFVVVYVYFTVWMTNRRQALLLETNLKDDAANKHSIDALLNYDTVKYFTNEKFEYQRFGDALEEWSAMNIKSMKRGADLNMGQGLIITAGLTGILVLAVGQFMKGQATIGDFVLVTTYLSRIAVPMNFLGFVYRAIKEGLADVDEMFKLLREKNTILDNPDAQELTTCGGEIRFENVDFSYFGREDVLKDINLAIPSRTRVALVGYSGSGKSTISKLLFRLYDVTSGKITIDGKDIRDLRIASLRNCLGIVAQDTTLFNDTIFNNIAYGRPGCTKEDVEEAAKTANIHDFILQLPQGYETVVGERGVKLSGGEKQRVAIARMLVKKPAVLIFDEATASLDTKSEKIIQDEIEKLSKGHITTIVIAHRLSTISDFDHIVVLEKGKIVEQGNHDELLAKQGVYYHLWQAQSKNVSV